MKDYDFPPSPAPGARRDHPIEGLSLRFPIEPTSDVVVGAQLTVGETVLDGSAKFQRPVCWLEAEGTGDDRFDFGACGVLITGSELKLQRGLRPKGGSRHPSRQRSATGQDVKPGELLSFTLHLADGVAVLDAFGRVAGGIEMPAATRIVAVHFGLQAEGDFRKGEDGKRDKTRPANWQPLYGWNLDALAINGLVKVGPSHLPSDPPPKPDPSPPPAPLPSDPPRPPQSFAALLFDLAQKEEDKLDHLVAAARAHGETSALLKRYATSLIEGGA